MNYQWYPGHMTKARRMMEENIKLIDLVIELVDARTPGSSRNPDIDTLAKGKSRIILLNKSDLADPACNAEWKKFFEEKGFIVAEVNSKSGKGVRNIQDLVDKACKEKIERDRRRGIVNRPIRAMIVGIPNVGKSTFINALAGRSAAKTGNKPGVTKGKQWISIGKRLELLDTPGILWPKFEDQEVGKRLAAIGSINDEILIMEELAISLLEIITPYYSEQLQSRYNGIQHLSGLEALQDIAECRKCYLKGAEPDIVKASNILVDDFREGRIGRITIERPTKIMEAEE